MTDTRPLVLLESPLSSPYEYGLRLHRAYLDAIIADSLDRDEVPIATHKLYPEALDDNDPRERDLGIQTAHRLRRHVDLVAVYFDLGISPGMILGIKEAKKVGLRLEFRSLYSHPIPSHFSEY